MPYNNITTHTHISPPSLHTHTHTHTHKHVRQGDSHGDEKDSSEIIIEEVRLEGGFKRGGRIRVVECLRQNFSQIRMVLLWCKSTYNDIY